MFLGLNLSQLQGFVQHAVAVLALIPLFLFLFFSGGGGGISPSDVEKHAAHWPPKSADFRPGAGRVGPRAPARCGPAGRRPAALPKKGNGIVTFHLVSTLEKINICSVVINSV